MQTIQRTPANANKRQDRMLIASNLASKERTDLINGTLERLNLKNNIAEMQSQTLNNHWLSKGIITGNPPENSFNRLSELKDNEAQKSIMRKNLYKIFGNRDSQLENVYSALYEDPNDVLFFNTYFSKILQTLNENIGNAYLTPQLFIAFYNRFKQKQEREYAVNDPIQDNMALPLRKLNEGDTTNQNNEIIAFMRNTYDVSKFGFSVAFLLKSMAVDGEIIDKEMPKMLNNHSSWTVPSNWSLMVNYVFRSAMFIHENQRRENVLKHNYKKLTKYLKMTNGDVNDLISFSELVFERAEHLMDNEIFAYTSLLNEDADEDGEDAEMKADTEYGGPPPPREDLEEGEIEELGEEDYTADVRSGFSEMRHDHDGNYMYFEEINERLKVKIEKRIEKQQEEKRRQEMIEQSIRNKRIKDADDEYFEKIRLFEEAQELQRQKLEFEMSQRETASVREFFERHKTLSLIMEMFGTAYDKYKNTSEEDPKHSKMYHAARDMLKDFITELNSISEPIPKNFNRGIVELAEEFALEYMLPGQKYMGQEDGQYMGEGEDMYGEDLSNYQADTRDYSTMGLDDTAQVDESKGDEPITSQTEMMNEQQGIVDPSQEKNITVRIRNKPPIKYIFNRNSEVVELNYDEVEETNIRSKANKVFTYNTSKEERSGKYLVTNLEFSDYKIALLIRDSYKNPSLKPTYYLFHRTHFEGMPPVLFRKKRTNVWTSKVPDGLDDTMRAYETANLITNYIDTAEKDYVESGITRIPHEVEQRVRERQKQMTDYFSGKTATLADMMQPEFTKQSADPVKNPNTNDNEELTVQPTVQPTEEKTGAGFGFSKNERHSRATPIQKTENQGHENRRYLMRGMMR